MCDEKLNLAKLLSGCPKGTKLWSPLFGELNLEFVEKRSVGAPYSYIRLLWFIMQIL